MAYTFKQNLVSSSKYSIKCPYSLTPEYITVHDTANSASASNEIAYMISNSNQVSFHIAVDESNCIQGLPLNRNAWACGDGANGTGNRKSINVEICRPTNSNRSLYDQAEENAVYVLARLLNQYGLGIDKLKRHYDWSGKNCPAVILNEGRWESFKSRVNTVLNAIKSGKCDASLSSGTTTISTSTTTQEVKTVAVETVDCQKKVKFIKACNVWADTSYKTVKSQVTKDRVVHVTKQTKDGAFYMIDNGYVSTSSEFSLCSVMNQKPTCKVMPIRNANLFTYSDGKYCIGQAPAWAVYEAISYKNGYYMIYGVGWIHESNIKKFDVDALSCTNGLV